MAAARDVVCKVLITSPSLIFLLNLPAKYVDRVLPFGFFTNFKIKIFFPSSLDQQRQPCASPDKPDTDMMKAILFILDRFSISLEGYHELTQLHSSLPRTHQIQHVAGFGQ